MRVKMWRSKMKKIYIAGPDVFEKDSIAIGKKLIQLCREYGYEGLYPLDNVVDFSQAKHKIAEDIYEANVAMIEKADIVIANLSSFRGKEADSGTVWECGYAYARGKQIYGYVDRAGEYIEQFSSPRDADGVLYDAKGRYVEDFGHPLNLMIACSAQEIIEGGFEDVLKLLVGSETL
jgi:nucleoside 2-deoxyribosyltransferase